MVTARAVAIIIIDKNIKICYFEFIKLNKFMSDKKIDDQRGLSDRDRIQSVLEYTGTPDTEEKLKELNLFLTTVLSIFSNNINPKLRSSTKILNHCYPQNRRKEVCREEWEKMKTGFKEAGFSSTLLPRFVTSDYDELAFYGIVIRSKNGLMQITQTDSDYNFYLEFENRPGSDDCSLFINGQQFSLKEKPKLKLMQGQEGGFQIIGIETEKKNGILVCEEIKPIKFPDSGQTK